MRQPNASSDLPSPPAKIPQNEVVEYLALLVDKLDLLTERLGRIEQRLDRIEQRQQTEEVEEDTETYTDTYVSVPRGGVIAIAVNNQPASAPPTPGKHQRYSATSPRPFSQVTSAYSIASNTSGQSRAGPFKISKSPNPLIPQQTTQHSPTDAPSSSCTARNDIEEEKPFKSPDEVARRLGTGTGPPYYVVTHGNEPGIYTDWLQVALTSKAIGGIWAKRMSKVDAIKAYRNAYEANALKRM